MWTWCCVESAELAAVVPRRGMTRLWFLVHLMMAECAGRNCWISKTGAVGAGNDNDFEIKLRGCGRRKKEIYLDGDMHIGGWWLSHGAERP